MKTKYMLAALLLFTACSEIDNYEAPDGAVHGRLIDAITNENFQSEQPNGFNIKLFERGGELNSPITFPGKPDGTFENAWIFQNEYRVLPTEGAFFPVDTAVVQVGGRTEVNFTVVPFLAVENFSVTVSQGTISSSYTIARAQAAEKIIERKTLVSKIPTVSNTIFDYKKDTNVSEISDTDLLSVAFADEVSVPPGEYYVRVAVLTNNALKRYNYSQVVKISVP